MLRPLVAYNKVIIMDNIKLTTPAAHHEQGKALERHCDNRKRDENAGIYFLALIINTLRQADAKDPSDVPTIVREPNVVIHPPRDVI